MCKLIFFLFSGFFILSSSWTIAEGEKLYHSWSTGPNFKKARPYQDLSQKNPVLSNFAPESRPAKPPDEEPEKKKLLKTNQAFLSQNKASPVKKLSPAEKIRFLENISTKKTSLEIHNKALELLKAREKNQALLLLKKNLYTHLFPSSYFALYRLSAPLFFSSFLWHISLFFMALTALFFIFLALKKPDSFRLKCSFFSLILFSLIFSGGFFLKKKANPLEEIDLKDGPFPSAPVKARLSPASDLVVLKQTKDWLRVRDRENQTGWVLKKELFQIF